jgi:hypothetical protein
MTRNRLIAAAAILAATASLLAFGIVGIGRGGGKQNVDGAVLWAAGRCWLNHQNPYDHDQLTAAANHNVNLTRIIFFYPPQSAAICIPQALFKYPTARVLWLLANLLSIAFIIELAIHQIHIRDPSDQLGPWIIAAVAIGNPFTTHVIWMGQTSLVATAATMAAFAFAFTSSPGTPGLTSSPATAGEDRGGGWISAGIFLGVASFKPQLCLLLGFWFLLERKWKLLLVALATAIAMSLYPLTIQGPIEMLRAWHEALQLSYSSLIYNAPGSPHRVGLDSLLQAANIKVPSAAIGILATFIAWLLRRHWNRADLLAILMALTFVFVGYSHDYDYVALIPLLLSLWIYNHRHLPTGILALFLTALLFFPQRAVRTEQNPFLDQWRTLVIFAMLLMIILQSAKSRSRNPPAPWTV